MKTFAATTLDGFCAYIQADSWAEAEELAEESGLTLEGELYATVEFWDMAPVDTIDRIN